MAWLVFCPDGRTGLDPGGGAPGGLVRSLPPHGAGPGSGSSP